MLVGEATVTTAVVQRAGSLAPDLQLQAEESLGMLTRSFTGSGHVAMPINSITTYRCHSSAGRRPACYVNVLHAHDIHPKLTVACHGQQQHLLRLQANQYLTIRYTWCMPPEPHTPLLVDPLLLPIPSAKRQAK